MSSQTRRCLMAVTFAGLGCSPVLFTQGPVDWTTGTLEDLFSVQSISAPVLSPDGRQLAFVRDGQILLMPSEGGWPATLTTAPGGRSGVTWSPDGEMLAYASHGALWVVPAAGGQPVRLTTAPPGTGDGDWGAGT